MSFDLQLKNLGFSDKEAKVYVALLEFGQAAALDIARSANVNRATMYVILDELKAKGLISTFEKEKARGRSGKKTFFVAEPPDRLRAMLERQEWQLKEGLQNFSGLLPDLARLYEARGERPKVRFFEGKEGVLAIREDLYSTKTDYFYEITNLDAVRRFLPADKKGNHKMTEKLKGIRARTIYSSSDEHVLVRTGKWERKFISDLNFSSELVLYADKIAMVAYKKDIFGIIIDDSTLTSTLKLFFELLWNSCKTET